MQIAENPLNLTSETPLAFLQDCFEVTAISYSRLTLCRQVRVHPFDIWPVQRQLEEGDGGDVVSSARSVAFEQINNDYSCYAF